MRMAARNCAEASIMFVPPRASSAAAASAGARPTEAAVAVGQHAQRGDADCAEPLASRREAGQRWRAVPPVDTHYLKQPDVWGPFGSVATGTVVEQS